MRVARLLGAAMVATLAACASIPPQSPPGFDRVTGRFSAVYQLPERFDNVQVAQGSFVLTQSQRGRIELDLASPFGQTLARIEVDESLGLATLEASDGAVYRAASAETLTEDLLGWRVPVRSLVDWIDSRPGASPPRAPASRWQVSVDEWGDKRPRRMTLRWPEPGTERPADAGRHVRIRLVIDS